MNKNIRILVLLSLIGIQWIIVGWTIFEPAKTLKRGTLYQFKTVPIDPHDPFRGKYVDLRFEQSSIEVDQFRKIEIGDEIFVELLVDAEGFANVGVSYPVKPVGSESDYLTATVASIKDEGAKLIVSIRYPFHKFFIEEGKAEEIEKYYRESMADTANVGYAEVYVYKGNATLSDLKINGTSILDLIEFD